MYLTGDAKLWWRTRNADDVSAGRPRIDTWNKLMKEMRDQFLPSNASWLARDKLKRLRQTGSVRDYIKEFTSVMKNVKDLPGAIAAADLLVDFRTTRPNTDIPSTSKPKRKAEKKGDGKSENRRDYANDKGKAPMKEGNKENRPKNKDGNSKGCWTCGGPHLAKSCPNRERVNALLAGNLNHNEKEEEVVAAMVNPLVNPKAQAIVGIAYGVSMSTENWVGKHNLMVMLLGDFEIIFGVYFLRKFQFVPFSHLDGIMIMNEGNAGFVKGVYLFGKVNKIAKKKDK
ncbi:hypothetical protein KY289_024413 [Solanum tuberosum]|nr:hypothetical protein KY289_024413 [Solanum tuberosum]